MEKLGVLDYILVPVGIGIMLAYHLWLLYRIVVHPTKTVIGINAINRRIWVRTMMQDTKNGILAVQTLRNSIMASTLMSSTGITLGSLIVVLMTSSNTKSDSHNNDSLILGHGGQTVKFFSILVCFLLAFLLNAQSVRYYSHANILINVPALLPSGSIEYVTRTMNRGSYFWSLGLRSYYFSFPLFIWVFGPVPMVLCCVVMVIMLYFLDLYSEWNESASTNEIKDLEEGGRD